MIARGAMLGPDQPVIIHMLDIAAAAEALNGVKMELIDAAFPLLKGIHFDDRFLTVSFCYGRATRVFLCVEHYICLICIHRIQLELTHTDREMVINHALLWLDI